GHRRPYHRDDQRALRARDGEERVTTGFDANVPARKPRMISRVLSELTAVPENGKPPATIELAATAPAPDVTPPPAAPKPNPRAARGKSGPERAGAASLRERLAMSAHRSAAGAEPQQTAAAVRELIEAMRARLESAIEERTRLAGELEEARAALGRGAQCGRGRAGGRWRELTSDVERLSAAGEALEALESLVRRSP